jgi:hypothetical protein
MEMVSLAGTYELAKHLLCSVAAAVTQLGNCMRDPRCLGSPYMSYRDTWLLARWLGCKDARTMQATFKIGSCDRARQDPWAHRYASTGRSALRPYMMEAARVCVSSESG